MSSIAMNTAAAGELLEINQLYYLATEFTVSDEYLANLQQEDLSGVRLLQAACSWNVSAMSEVVKSWHETGERRAQILSRAALAAFDLGNMSVRFSWSPEKICSRRAFEELFESVDFLVEAGADLNMLHVKSGSLVHSAAGSRSGLMMQYAIDHGCDPNQLDEDGIQPIQHCLVNGVLGDNLAVLRVLLRAGADPLGASRADQDTMWISDPSIVFMMLAYGGQLPNVIGAGEYAEITPLKAAAMCKDHERILELMQQAPPSSDELDEVRAYLAEKMAPDDPIGCGEVRATIEAFVSHQILRGIAASARSLRP